MYSILNCMLLTLTNPFHSDLVFYLFLHDSIPPTAMLWCHCCSTLWRHCSFYFCSHNNFFFHCTKIQIYYLSYFSTRMLWLLFTFLTSWRKVMYCVCVDSLVYLDFHFTFYLGIRMSLYFRHSITIFTILNVN